MKLTRASVLVAMALLTAWMSTRSLHSQNASTTAGLEEYLVIGDPTRGAGEPQIAVNPSNPKNILITAMGNLHRLGEVLPEARGGAGGPIAAPGPAGRGAPPGRSATSAAPVGGAGGDPTTATGRFYRTKDATLCQVAVTMDGGQSWTIGALPLLHDQYIRCSDVFAAAGPDGTLYAGGEPLSAPLSIEGAPGRTRRDCWASYVYSTDGGKTWSKPVEILGSDSIKQGRFAAGLKPDINGLPTDRPWIDVDQSDGTVYVSTRGAVTEGRQAQQRWVTATRDRGRTLNTIYALDSDEYPVGNGGSDTAAAHGVLAAVYIAASVPGRENATCPCLVFETSQDLGKTFDRHVVRDLPASAAGGPFNLFVSADPTKAGRYALTTGAQNGSALATIVTADGGRTWSAPAVVSTAPGTQINKPWVEYGPGGDLGVMWRALYPNGSYEVWASVSRDAGKTFAAPIKVSRTPSPPPARERGNFLFGDDTSMVVLDRETLHLVWGDSRAGFQGTWYGRVPFALFTR